MLALSVLAVAWGQALSGTYEIVNANSGMLLDDPASSTSDGAFMDQWTGNGGANQHWTVASLGGGLYEIANSDSGLALEVYGQSTSVGAGVDQWQYWGGSNQQWHLGELANGAYEITNANSSLSLEVAKQSLADGGSIDQASWWAGANQQWFLLPMSVQGTVAPGSASSGARASTFHGFNWACPGDNYQDGPLVLSGLSLPSSHAAVESVAASVLGEFKRVGANTVRIPINPETAIGSWWGSYRGVIDEATHLGMKVVIANWTGTGRAGTVNDTPSFFNMWDVVVTAYNPNPNVYFEILNEPYGYSSAAWLGVVSSWLQRYPTVSHSRVLVGGTGYCQNIPAVGSSPLCTGCLFSVHDYGFWNSRDTSRTGWIESLSNQVGAFSERTVLTEFGAPMTRGWDYAGSDLGNNGIASINGFCDYCHDADMGSIYWPGLRDGDSYSMFALGRGAALELNSPTGLDVVQYGWRSGPALSKGSTELQNRGHERDARDRREACRGSLTKIRASNNVR